MKQFVKIICILLTVCCISTALVSCSCSSEGEVSVFYYTYADAYISSVRSEMDAYFRLNGIKHHNYDSGSNQATQTEQVDTAISKGTSMLIVNIVDTGSDDAAKTIVRKAQSADIPVIFFNRSVSDEVIASYDKCLFVGTDYEMAGRLQGEMVGNYLKDNYKDLDINGDGRISYVMFKGQQGNAEAEARTTLSVSVANSILANAARPPLLFYDKQNSDGYLVDQDGNWSNAAANNYMKTILSGYSEDGGNMIELVIANNDEMALGALAALEEAGYNRSGDRIIPVFGVDATEAAKEKIRNGSMAGTVKQDAKGMAEAIGKIAANIKGGMSATDGIDKEMMEGEKRINIPYSTYTKEGDQ